MRGLSLLPFHFFNCLNVPSFLRLALFYLASLIDNLYIMSVRINDPRCIVVAVILMLYCWRWFDTRADGCRHVKERIHPCLALRLQTHVKSAWHGLPFL